MMPMFKVPGLIFFIGQKTILILSYGIQIIENPILTLSYGIQLIENPMRGLQSSFWVTMGLRPHIVIYVSLL